MSPARRHSVNCAFEAVENHRFSRLCEVECLVVVVTADLANCHIKFPFRLQRALSPSGCTETICIRMTRSTSRQEARVYLSATASRLYV